MNPNRIAPRPIFDNLTETGNPFKQQTFSAEAFFLQKPLTGANVDYEYALKFLYSYQGSSATFNAYRRELERFLQWSWHIESQSILLLKRENIEAFVRFCLNPPHSWIGTANTPRFINQHGQRVINKKWRPFVVSVSKDKHRQGIEAQKNDYVMSQATLRALFAILSSFYDYLCQEELLESNPVALIRQKSKFLVKEQNVASVRRLSNLQWGYVIETVEHQATDDPENHERILFVMNCLYAMYLRISELVADERSEPRMKDFKRDHDGHWWFYVTGKGNKSRKISVSDAMLMALKRYRRFRGLTVLPTPDDDSPILPKQRGKGPMKSTRHLRSMVQRCFDTAYSRMKKDGLEDDAADLKAATVHWLRHTGISEDVKIRPREHVRDDAGHQSMQTTDRYIESDDRERHLSARAKPISDAR